MKKLITLFLCLTSVVFLSSCKKNKPSPSDPSQEQSESETESIITPSISENESESEETPSIIDGLPVNVYFFYDYNHANTKDALLVVKSHNGDLISEHPDDLTTSYYEEFPVFKGWSQKEIIDSEEDLWDFEHDVVQSYTSTFRLYGIWVAEGE